MQALQVQRAMFFAFMIQHELKDEQNHRKTMNLLAIGAGSCISGAGASAASVVSIGALPSFQNHAHALCKNKKATDFTSTLWRLNWSCGFSNRNCWNRGRSLSSKATQGTVTTVHERNGDWLGRFCKANHIASLTRPHLSLFSPVCIVFGTIWHFLQVLTLIDLGSPTSPAGGA